MYLTAILLLLDLSAITIAIHYYKKTSDIFDPRIIFVLAYAFLTTGPIIWYLLNDSLYSGIIIEHAPSVLLSGFTAIFSFTIGASLVIKKNIPLSTRDTINEKRLIIAFYLCAFALFLTIVMYFYYSGALRLSSGESDKSKILAYASRSDHRAFTFIATLLFAISILFIALQSKIETRASNNILFVALFLLTVLTLKNGERDSALIFVILILFKRKIWKRKKIFSMAFLALLIIALVPLTRSKGLSANSQIALAQEQNVKGITESIMTKMSTNLFIFTQIIEWTDNSTNYQYGYTYIEALLTFIPIDTTKQKSLSRWFKNKYAPHSPVNYGFGMDAEAYLNFGFFGPPIWFFFLGIFLGKLYTKSINNSGVFWEYWWALVTIYAIFSIRSDSRVFFKMVIYGGLLGKIFLFISKIIDYRNHKSKRI